ncbi:MAG: Bax inhibitor-1/YccA family protein [Sporocytophaga sp.]|uniref:Bax inhibitor-1/YccA family protein n=1 Tax=Sporocytophaga sp. TaxID=2231183 RepID=UPI001B11122A|nr:Bax inhibitor-1/YccA family protein [Sporocytophaga sp.]MBO9701069.1 Bax inhibitor-1/YccA family protein [Sporocytophaga sp.]
MEKDNLYYSQGKSVSTMSQSFMANVFIWMSAGLVMTAAISFLFAHNASLLSLLINERGWSIFGYIVLFAPIGFVLLMNFAFEKLSYGMLVLLFMTYSALMGMSLSVIFLVYTAGSIYSIFFVTAGMFAVTAIYGYTTKTDLTRIGNLLMMALFGIIIASVINMFLQSDTLSYIMSIVSVVVFTGLTAYNVQSMKDIYNDGSERAGKLAIIGAMSLYINFINLFLALLRLFGNRRD